MKKQNRLKSNSMVSKDSNLGSSKSYYKKKNNILIRERNEFITSKKEEYKLRQVINVNNLLSTYKGKNLSTFTKYLLGTKCCKCRKIDGELININLPNLEDSTIYNIRNAQLLCDFCEEDLFLEMRDFRTFEEVTRLKNMLKHKIYRDLLKENSLHFSLLDF